MGNDQISQLLKFILIILLVVLFVLLFFFIVLTIKKNNNQAPKKNNKDNEKSTKNQSLGYNKQSIFDFMEFDKIEDNMIIRKNGSKYIMAIECQGINYDLMSELEKNSVEQGFLQFLNTLRFPVQLYIQTRTINLDSSINAYKQRINEIRNDYMRKKMEYSSISNLGNQSQKAIDNAKFEMIKAQNLYEYGIDIIQNTEKMNFNKNILKKHYYVIISYMPEEISRTDYDSEEIKNMAFSELYTRAQAIVSSLFVCNIKGKVLNSKELVELMYIAYNRDEAEIYELEKILNTSFDEIYSIAPNVLEKRMKAIDNEIEKKAISKANESVRQAMYNIETERKLKEKEQKMDELIRIMAKSILQENEEMIGKETREEAEKIINN